MVVLLVGGCDRLFKLDDITVRADAAVDGSGLDVNPDAPSTCADGLMFLGAPTTLSPMCGSYTQGGANWTLFIGNIEVAECSGQIYRIADGILVRVLTGRRVRYPASAAYATTSQGA